MTIIGFLAKITGNMKYNDFTKIEGTQFRPTNSHKVTNLIWVLFLNGIGKQLYSILEIKYALELKGCICDEKTIRNAINGLATHSASLEEYYLTKKMQKTGDKKVPTSFWGFIRKE